jgi:hypothetical protein
MIIPAMENYYIIESPAISIPFPVLFIKSVDDDIHSLERISYSPKNSIDGFYPSGRQISPHRYL